MLKRIFLSVLWICVPFIILYNSRTVMQSVKDGLLICYNSVIPSLYVFMVFSKYIASSDTVGFLSLPLGWYGYLMKIKDKSYSTYLLLSLMGGFAVGATFLNVLKEKGYSENCLLALSPSLINNSLSFCVMAVGAGYLGNIKAGVLLFISLTLASLITSFLLSFIVKYNIVSQPKSSVNKPLSFVECINSSVQSILSICGFVILFNCICKVISLYQVSPIFSVFLEVTCGCGEVLSVWGKNLYLLCFALSIYPVSTLCQVYYFTNNFNIIKTLLYSRILHTPISLIIFSLLLNFFPVDISVLSPDSVAVKTFYNSMEISVTLFLITLSFICISDSNQLFTKWKK